LTASGSIESRAAARRPERQERIPLGILYMISATAVFAASSAISKLLVVRYPVGEVLFARNIVGIVLVGGFVLPRLGLAVFETHKLPAHFARSVSQGFSQTFILLAFSMLPLAGAVAINFSAPLFATLVAAFLFGEAVGKARWLALLVGFLGVLLVTHPGVGTFQIGSLFALANAVLYGSVTVGVRRMTATESTETLTLYQLVFLTIFFGLSLPFAFTMPTWNDAGIMALNGVANAVGQYWWTRSLTLAPTSAVVPFNYFSLVWAMILGFVIWGDMPTLSLLAGSAIVVGSGLFLLWSETTRRRRRASSELANSE
jgi:drug/metabolite transporter (DMT)-like permease